MVKSVRSSRGSSSDNKVVKSKAVITGLWMLKSEPWDISWKRLVDEQDVQWDNVRNFQANNYMKAMQQGDLCLFYHSVEDKTVFGVAQVLKTWQPDPKDVRFGVLRIGPVKALSRPVTLADLKKEPQLKELQFLRQVRLSVCIVSKSEWQTILDLGNTCL